MTFPTTAQGNAAHLRGQQDGIDGADRDAAPWSPTAATEFERCLAAVYQRGYGYGRQLRLQAKYGDIPQG